MTVTCPPCHVRRSGGASDLKENVDDFAIGVLALVRFAITFLPLLVDPGMGQVGDLGDEGKLDEALESFQNAVRLRPNFAEAHNSLGNILRRKGRLDEAVASLHEALRLKPNFAEAHNNLGNALQKKGLLDGAVASYEQALRLRREGTSNRVTYKGPRQGGPTKTREEIEIAFAQGAEEQGRMRRLWELLGFRPVAVLHKRRRAFSLDHQGRHLEVVLDEAEDLGTFVEVEAIAADEADLPAAQAAVLDLARELGLTEVEPRSYLRMALERRGEPRPKGGEEAAGGRNPAGQT